MEQWREELQQNELYHFGIMGMKWGVRRYQNPDGSLTAAGRSRYGSGGPARSGVSKKRTSGMAKALTSKKKGPKEDISKLTDQELRTKINRIQMERQYKQLSSPNNTRTKVNKTLKKIGNAAIMSVGTGLAIKYLTGGTNVAESGAKAVARALNSKATDAYFRKLARRMW